MQRQAAFEMDDPLNVLVPLDATQIENRQNVNGKKDAWTQNESERTTGLTLGDAREGGGGT